MIKESIVITAGQYRGVLDPPGHGVLVDIHRLIGAQTGLEIDLQIMPVRRARHIFYGGDAQAIFAIFTDVQRPVPTLYSAPFARVHRYIMTHRSKRTISNLTGLSRKQVGLVQGYVYNHLDMTALAQHGTRLNYQTNQLANLRMLTSARLDAIIANPYEIAMLAASEGIPMPVFDDSKPITIYDFAYGFHDTVKGRRLQAIFSQTIEKLQHQQELQRLTHLFEETLNKAP